MKYLGLLSILFLLPSYASWAQCYPDRHSTTWYDGWISCEANVNPNAARDISHWILYNFGERYALNKMKIWNTNDPLHLDHGLRNILIDYSIDGSTWTELGSFIISQAEGKSNFEGMDGPDFEGVQAQYVLITAIDNYGGSCYGLSEVRFETPDIKSTDISTPVANQNHCMSIKVYPNPFIENPVLDIQSNCQKTIVYTLHNAMGKTLLRQTVDGLTGINQTLLLDKLIPGVYFLDVNYGGKSIREKLIKIQ